jgi:hypothetical protein
MVGMDEAYTVAKVRQPLAGEYQRTRVAVNAKQHRLRRGLKNGCRVAACANRTVDKPPGGELRDL